MVIAIELLGVFIIYHGEVEQTEIHLLVAKFTWQTTFEAEPRV